ncbi:hypothetical protein ACFZC5_31605 [Nocardia gamkensis]|uniref:hypothetical protein n=1 Tax=Nocardia gamkensis TaxID=352869 RepID=UPI0036E8391D
MDEAVDGVVEADQFGGALGGQADSGAEAGPQSLATAAQLGGEVLDAETATAELDLSPCPGDLRVDAVVVPEPRRQRGVRQPVPGESGRIVGNLLFVPAIGQPLWPLLPDVVLRQAMSSAFTRDVQIPDQFVADLRGMTYRSLTATSTASDDYLRERTETDRLTDLGVPAMVLYGSQDNVGSRTLSRTTAASPASGSRASTVATRPWSKSPAAPARSSVTSQVSTEFRKPSAAWPGPPADEHHARTCPICARMRWL